MSTLSEIRAAYSTPPPTLPIILVGGGCDRCGCASIEIIALYGVDDDFNPSPPMLSLTGCCDDCSAVRVYQFAMNGSLPNRPPSVSPEVVEIAKLIFPLKSNADD